MLEGSIVGRREMPGEIGEQPEPERNRRLGQPPQRCESGEPLRDVRRDPEHEQAAPTR